MDIINTIGLILFKIFMVVILLFNIIREPED